MTKVMASRINAATMSNSDLLAVALVDGVWAVQCAFLGTQDARPAVFETVADSLGDRCLRNMFPRFLKIVACQSAFHASKAVDRVSRRGRDRHRLPDGTVFAKQPTLYLLRPASGRHYILCGWSTNRI